MQIPTLIIDDERLARQRLENLLNDVPEIDVIGHCKNGTEAIEKIEELAPRLIFLDVQMKDMTGFDVIEKVSGSQRPVIVFVTAFDEFAVRAFSYFAFDYLLKPFKDERFYKTITRVTEYIGTNDSSLFQKKINDLLEHIKGTSLETSSLYMNKLPVRLGNKISFINTDEIKYILASGYYAEIYVNDKKHLLRESLTKLISELNTKVFIRVHRSTIISVNYVQEIVSSNYGELDVKMNDNKLFRISKSYKKNFLTKMGI